MIRPGMSRLTFDAARILCLAVHETGDKVGIINESVKII